jgi:hypothetical protein
MTRTELIIQLLKVAIGLAFGAYFVWWSLQVLDRLTPEYDARTAVVARASGIREGLAAGESLGRVLINAQIGGPLPGTNRKTLAQSEPYRL